jgi:hypothetical protein
MPALPPAVITPATGGDLSAASGHPAVGPEGLAGGGGLAPAGFQRPRLIVTVPLATLLGQPLAPGATVLGPGTPLTGPAARRLACDAEVIRLVTGTPPSHPGGHGQPTDGRPGGCGRPGSSGNPTWDLTGQLAASIVQLPRPLAGPSAVLDIGRKSHGWTPRQRDALHAQYGGRCGHPGCSGPIDVIHHIIHWADGGPTSITNAYPCCLYHHWLIHEGGWRIIKHPDAAITTIPPPPGWRPGTIYRHGKPVEERTTPPNSS